MSTGIKSVIFALIALLAAGAIQYSLAGTQNYPNGIFTTMLLGNDAPPLAAEPERKLHYVRADSSFSIHEINIRRALTGILIISAFISFLLAILAARREQHSLWYSVSVALAAGAMCLLNITAGILALALVTACIVYLKQGKMTPD